MMKKFFKPQIEKIVLSSNDIITTSGGTYPSCAWDCDKNCKSGVCNNNQPT